MVVGVPAVGVHVTGAEREVVPLLKLTVPVGPAPLLVVATVAVSVTGEPAVTADAEVVHTPCGDGNLVWRRWGKGRPLVLVHGGSGSWTH